jgi:hypothetical protein
MEYIIINEVPYKKISYNNEYGNNRYGNECNAPNKRGAVICILIILIIIVLIIIGYMFYSTSGSSNQNNFKNKFQASPMARKDYEAVTNLLQKSPNPSYSRVKETMGDHIDIAKYDTIMKYKDTNKLQPELFDKI